MSVQLSLTAKNVHPPTMRYQPVEGGAAWQVEDWHSLIGEFGIKADELVSWHHAFSGSGRLWEILRRIYQVAPLFGDELVDDDFRIWTFAELAAKWAVPEKDLRTQHEGAVKFWRRQAEEVALAGKLAEQLSPGMPEFQSGPEVEDDKISPLLEQFGFDNEKLAANRKFIAKRILELRPQLETAVYRESARQVILMELNMRRYETMLSIRQTALDKKLLDAEQGKNVDLKDFEEQFRKTEKALTDLAETHRELLEDIGGDQEETEGQLRTAIDSFGYATDAMIAYYAKGDRELLDGVFTAGELRFALTITDVRDFQQYRPDVVTLIRQALMPENLWGGNASLTKLPREMCRKLKKICDALDEPEVTTIPAIDDGGSADDEDSDMLPPAPAMEMPPAEIQRMAAAAAAAPLQEEEGDFVVATED